MPVRKRNNMGSSEDIDIRNAVFEVLEDILKRPKDEFHVTDRLVRDLKVCSDDLSFLFVPELEKRVNAKVPVEEWHEVFTVQDTIDLLRKYKNPSIPAEDDKLDPGTT